MAVDVVCTNCGHGHRIPEREDDPETGGTRCPNCGERPYDVRREGLTWHHDP